MMDNTDIYKNFGKRLASLRIKTGLTQKEVAERMGTVQSTYSGYELGTRKITLEIVVKLASIFDVSPDYLILGEEKKPASQKTDEAILRLFHTLSDENKKKIVELARLYSGSQGQTLDK